MFRSALMELLARRLNDGEHCFAETVDDALACIDAHKPRLVVVDFSTGNMGEGGFEEIARAARGTPVVALDRKLDASRVVRSRAAGAKAYITKTSTPQLMDAALAVVVAGGEYFPHVATQEVGPLGGSPAWARALSPRQTDVLKLLVEGKTNREISDALAITTPTVKMHVHAILRAAGVRNRTEAALRFRKA